MSNRIKFNFDQDKALEVLLYITARVADMYSALKMLYFADKEHLESYGRLICGEEYVAMKNGPVPSNLYDIVKAVRGDGRHPSEEIARLAFTVDGFNIKPLREANLDFLSDSDVECLDKTIRENGCLSFSQLMEKSHDDAYKSADRNDFISLESIVKTLPSADLLLEHLSEC